MFDHQVGMSLFNTRIVWRQSNDEKHTKKHWMLSCKRQYYNNEYYFDLVQVTEHISEIYYGLQGVVLP